MIRTQISLTEEQHRRLHQVARARGTSISALIRAAVDEVVTDPERERHALRARARAAFGLSASGDGTLAEDHDRHLTDGPRW